MGKQGKLVVGIFSVGLCLLAFQNCKFTATDNSNLIGSSEQASAEATTTTNTSVSVVGTDGVSKAAPAAQIPIQIESDLQGKSSPNLLHCAVKSSALVKFREKINLTITLSSVLDRDARIVVNGYRSFTGMSQAWKFTSSASVERGVDRVEMSSRLFGTSAHLPGEAYVTIRAVDNYGSDICKPMSVKIVEDIPACKLELVSSASTYHVGDDVIMCAVDNPTDLPWGFNMAEVYGSVNGVDNITANIAAGVIPDRRFLSKVMYDNSSLPAKYKNTRCYKFDVRSSTAKGRHSRSLKLYYGYTSSSDFTQRYIPVCQTNSVEYSIE